ncbi:MAG: alkaline phosphatase family protein, partial [Acidimicrobiales bacterium]
IVPWVLALAATPAVAQLPRPALVVVITVDQLRPDYLVRYRSQLQGGLARLLERGAVFEHAYQDHAITETAVGHATLLAGRHPARHGIIRNETGVQDSTAPLLNRAGGGASPFRFRGTVLFDWLKVRDLRSRALSLSIKDRAAILPMGRTREQVYWYARGEMTTSTYYAAKLPQWVQRFNARNLPGRAAGRAWELLLALEAYPEPDSVPWERGGQEVAFGHRLPRDADGARTGLPATPFADEYLLAFALEGVQRMDLGRGAAPDLLAISLSATDYIGHRYGPASRENHDQVLRLDRAIGAFLDSLYRLRDSASILVALTADHGVTAIPERTVAVGQGPAERVADDFAARMDSALRARLGPPDDGRPWVEIDNGLVTMQARALARRGVSSDSLVGVWVREARTRPAVLRVDTRRTLAAADT